MRRRIRLFGTEGADRRRDFKRFWLAAALCALAVSAAGCGSSGKGGEDQEVAWETREKNGEEEAENASDASNETGEREGKEAGENGGEGQSAEGETAGGKTGVENSAAGKEAGGENADGAAAAREKRSTFSTSRRRDFILRMSTNWWRFCNACPRAEIPSLLSNTIWMSSRRRTILLISDQRAETAAEP